MNDDRNKPAMSDDGHMEVRNAIDRCTTQATRAREALDRLEDRIKPILASAPDTNQGAVPSEGTECEVAASLSNLCDRVQNLAEHLESITARVRV